MTFFLRPIVKIQAFLLNDKSETFTHIRMIISDPKKVWRWARFLVTALHYRKTRGIFSDAQKTALRRIALNG